MSEPTDPHRKGKGMERVAIVLVAALATLASGHVVAQKKKAAAPKKPSSPWIMISSGDDASFSVKAGSFKVEKDVAGELVGSYLVQFSDKKTKQLEYSRWIVSRPHCEQGYGNIVLEDVDGSNRRKHDFVVEGGNALSHIGSEICLGIAEELEWRSKQQATCATDVASAQRDYARLSGTEPAPGEQDQHVVNLAVAAAIVAATETCLEEYQ